MPNGRARTADHAHELRGDLAAALAEGLPRRKGTRSKSTSEAAQQHAAASRDGSKHRAELKLTVTKRGARSQAKQAGIRSKAFCLLLLLAVLAALGLGMPRALQLARSRRAEGRGRVQWARTQARAGRQGTQGRMPIRVASAPYRIHL